MKERITQLKREIAFENDLIEELDKKKDRALLRKKELSIELFKLTLSEKVKVRKQKEEELKNIIAETSSRFQ